MNENFGTMRRFAGRVLTASIAAAALVTALPATAQDAVTPLVSTDWVERHLDDPEVLLVHVAMLHQRVPSVIIPGAVLLDYHAITVSNDLPIEMPPVADLVASLASVGVGDDRHVVLYGSAPAHMAARAFVALEYLGHPRVSVMDGGIGAWQDEGRPTAASGATPVRGDLTARIDSSILVDADWINAHLDDPAVALIDARPAGEFRGRAMGGLRQGHIPGAGNIYYGDLVESERVHLLKPEGDVRRMLADAGAAAGTTIVSYCQIGMRASYNYLVARHLGYDVKFYDGSWADWGRRPDLPAETGEQP